MRVTVVTVSLIQEVARNAPSDQLVPVGGILLILEDVQGAADLGLRQAQGGGGVQERQELLDNVRIFSELLSSIVSVVAGHLVGQVS